MDKELELNLYRKLKELENENEKINIKFEVDAGERIVQFYVKKKKISYRSDRLWSELSSHLEYKIDLSSNQNFYSDGEGCIFINNENEIKIDYSKYSFYDNDETGDYYDYEMKIQVIPEGKVLLKNFLLSKTSFCGSIWLKKEKTSKFEIKIHDKRKNKFLIEIEEIKKKIEEKILEDVVNELNKCKEIIYSGIISNECIKVKVEERRYKVYEDFSEEIYLFKNKK